MNILDRIRETAKREPEKKAFVFEDEFITYGQLWYRSGVLAKGIEKSSIGPKLPIPVYGHKNSFMLVCFLACVRSGHAYVPMDTNMPEKRIRDILETVNSPVAFFTELPSFETGDIDIIDREKICTILKCAISYGLTDPDSKYENKKDDIHYMIFTSGSTGKPKGVQITTGNLENYLDWAETLVENKSGIFMNQAPFSFDLSVMDTYTGLATGSTVVCLNRKMTENLEKTVDYLKENKVNYWVSTPSFAELCLGNEKFNGENLPEIKKFLFCGETLTRQLALKLISRFPYTDIINTYGPTETTVCITAVKITEEIINEEEMLPVGYVKAGSGMYAIDKEGGRLSAGERGELVITGNTLSLGYFKNEEQTKKHFYMDTAGNRAYKTGDLGYVNEDGCVYVSGRADDQIKLHGYRIELGDIEKNLAGLKDVDEAAVITEKKDGKINSLAAFILQKPEIDTSYNRRKAIRRELGNRLPAYMVPKKVILLNEFPMTLNGKLDRKKLESML